MNATAVTPEPAPATQPPIAVVGVAALFLGEGRRLSFWQDILAGADLTRETPPSHWLMDDYYDPDPSKRGKTYAKRGAFLPKVPFDPVQYGVPPDLLPCIDTAQLLALIVASRVIDDALGGQFTHVAKARTSVILGVASATALVGQMAASIQRPVWRARHARRHHRTARPAVVRRDGPCDIDVVRSPGDRRRRRAARHRGREDRLS
ncbi:MAG TPA: beta-ketoacyl synthase N-terminal-like domain-containing protein, partial [Roseiarcus sp.]|nr:beta-ketoacyl synthase N-terminal-like domain-containing protein [Roseiarcus sp.]